MTLSLSVVGSRQRQGQGRRRALTIYIQAAITQIGFDANSAIAMPPTIVLSVGLKVRLMGSFGIVGMDHWENWDQWE